MYFLLSLILHLILLIPLAQRTSEQKKQESAGQYEVEMVESSAPKNEAIIPKFDGGEKSLDEKRFYWGIGINSVEYYSGEYLVTDVSDISAGYCAEAAGLKVDDKIYLVNGAPQSADNSIRGDGPRKLELTIMRGTDIIKLKLERCKVYY